MIELLVGLGILALIVWVIWGSCVFFGEFNRWYPFKNLYWWEYALMVGPVAFILFFAWLMGVAVLH